MRSKKGGSNVRRKNALALLQKQYETFKAAKSDKKPRVVVRNGIPIEKQGRSYEQECKRMLNEIETLKKKIR